ncbi:hypothetical protein XENTR_v10023411 [Xenopus tropicalis]|nr:hypothetical protein XENTR_v10023411 [Xenopus tropicalis]
MSYSSLSSRGQKRHHMMRSMFGVMTSPMQSTIFMHSSLSKDANPTPIYHESCLLPSSLLLCLGNALKCVTQNSSGKGTATCKPLENKCLTVQTKTYVIKMCATSGQCTCFRGLCLPAEKISCCDKDLCNA